MWNENDRKWLYETMSSNGVDTGSYEEFANSLNNKEDRDWYYNKSLDLGLDVGSAEDFYGMMVQPQQPKGGENGYTLTEDELNWDEEEPKKSRVRQKWEALKNDGNEEEEGDSGAIINPLTPEKVDEVAQQVRVKVGITPDVKKNATPNHDYGWNAKHQKQQSKKQQKVVANQQTEAVERARTKFGSLDDASKVKTLESLFGKPINEIEQDFFAATDRRVNGDYDLLFTWATGGNLKANELNMEHLVDKSTIAGKSGYTSAQIEAGLADEKITMEYMAGKQMAELEEELGSLENEVKAKAGEIQAKWNEEKPALWDIAMSTTDQRGMISADAVQQAMSVKGIPTEEAQDAARELDMINYARQNIAKAKNMQGLSQTEGGGTKQFVAGMASAFLDPDTWTSAEAIKRGQALQGVIDKIDNEGEGTLTPAEQKFLESVVMLTAYNEMYAEGTSSAAAAGKSFMESIPFMFEMAINPLRGTGKVAGKKLAKWAMKRFSSKTMKKGALVTGKAIGNVAGSAVAGYSTAGTMQLGDTVAGVQERMQGDVVVDLDDDGDLVYGGQKNEKDLPTAVYEETTERMLDTASEIVGAGYVSMPFRQLRKWGRGTRSLGWIDNLANSRFGRQLDNFLEKTGWHGPIEEFMEEVHVGLLSPALLEDSKLKDFFNEKDLTTTLIAVAVPGAITSSLSTAVGTFDGSFKLGAQEKWKMQNADRMARALWGDNIEQWNKIKSSLDNGSIENTEDTLSEVDRTIKAIYADNTLTNEQKKAALEYAVYSLQYKTATGVRDAMTVERKDALDDMFHEIYGTSFTERVSPAQANKSYKAFQAATAKAEKVLGLNGLSVEEWMNGRGVAEAADGNADIAKVLTEYLSAKMDFEGKRDRFIHDRDRAYRESDMLVDDYSNNGMIYTTRIDNQDVYITGGNVVLHEDGVINWLESSEELYVRMPDGKVLPIAPMKLIDKVVAVSAESVKLEERAKIDANFKAEFDAAEVQEDQTASGSPVKTASNSADAFTLVDNGIAHTVEVVAPNNDGMTTSIMLDGEQKIIPNDLLNTWREAAGVSQTENGESSQTENGNVKAEGATSGDVVSPVETTQPIEQPGLFNETAQTETAQPQLVAPVESQPIPMEKRGKEERAAYHMVPIERTMEDLDANELTQEEKEQFTQANIDEITKDIEALDKKEPKMGANIQAYKTAKQQWQSTRGELQARLDYYNALMDRLKQPIVEVAAVEQTAEQPAVESVPVAEQAAEVAPTQVESTPVTEQTAVEETPQATNEMQPVQEESGSSEIPNGSTVSQASEQVGDQVAEGEVKTESGEVKTENAPSEADAPGQSGVAASEGNSLANAVLEKAAEKQKKNLNDRIREAVTKGRIKQWEKRTGISVRVVESIDEVTNRQAHAALEAGQIVKGWIDGNEVVIYLPNIESVEDVDKTYIHEVVAHKGLKILMGKDFDKLCDKVWEMMSEELRKEYLAYIGANLENPTQADMRDAADEYMAYLAESVELTETEKGIWQKIVDAIREFLLGEGVKLTDKDIENLIRASYANLANKRAKVEAHAIELGAEVEFVYDGNVYNMTVKNKSEDGYVSLSGEAMAMILPEDVLLEGIKQAAALKGGNDGYKARRVFHGSGAKFDRFDHSHMGEGEGAQAYGWGTYVTEVEGIGRTYALTMRDKVISEKHKENAIVNNLARQTLASNNGDKNAALEELRNLLNESWSDKKRVKAQIKIIETGKFLPETKVKAHLYNVEIPDDNGTNYLRWKADNNQETIDKLNEAYRNMLLERGVPAEDISPYFEPFGKGLSGMTIYDLFARELGGDKAASEFLNRQGFVGISYPAQAMTGGRADDARNYVIFNENDAQIESRTMFRIAKTPQEFDATQKEAVEKRGIVAPNLNSAVVNVVDVPKHDFTGSLKEARAQAEDWAVKNYTGREFDFPDNSGKYVISKKAIGKYLDKTAVKKSDNAAVHLSALKKLPEIISDSIEVELHADYKKDGEGRSGNEIDRDDLLIHRLYGAINIGGNTYRVKTTIREFKDVNTPNSPHSYEVTKIELIEDSTVTPDGIDSPLNRPINSISATKLLNGVEKSYDKGKFVLGESEKSSAEEENRTRFRKANENQKIFVSNARKAVEEIKQEKATPQQWLAMIKKNGGLKAGEDAWMGLSEWLENNESKSLTKQEVLDFVNENAIKIEEVRYAEEQMLSPNSILNLESTVKLALSRGESIEDGLNSWDDEFGDNMLEAYKNGTIRIDEEGNVTTSENLAFPINETRENYTTDGLENKREIALVVPTIEPYNQSDEIHFGDAGNGRAVAWVRFGETTADTDETIAAKKAVNDYLAEMREKYNTLEGEETDAMTAEEIERLQELTAKEIESGEKKARVLVIDEIQSKRHQDGREKGYRGVGLAKEVLAAEEEVRKTNRELTAYREPLKEKYNFKELGSSMFERLKNFDAMLSEEERITMDALGQARNEAEKRLQELRGQERGIPSAPFEKNWQELAMKRMLRLAAEEGFDKVAWTTGEQQAERYNISKQVERIDVEDNGVEEFSDGTLVAKNVALRTANDNVVHLYVDADGVAHGREFDGKSLAEIVGKELAEKIMQPGDFTIEGDGLRIGGEGMKGFYDKMLPSFVSKYTKKWGAKVGTVEMPSLEQNNVMHSVDVTPEMKESVMEGQTMFRRGGRNDRIFENKNITLHTTGDGRIVRYEQLELFDTDERTTTDIQRGASGGNQTADNRTRTGDIQRDGLAGGDALTLINAPLRPLEEGETSLVQRVFTKSKAFDFTAGEQIESLEDVAYIFKNLEDESIENSFAVLVKDGKPVVLHLGMGHYTSSIINASAVAVAMENVKPDKVYLVHNHPSGALKASAEDVDTLKGFRTVYGDIVEKGIIINLKSGKFGIYDTAQETSEERSTKVEGGAEIPVETFAFNKQVFDKDFNPAELFQVKDDSDVAAFISSNRLGDRNKIGLLVCNNQNRVVGNVFTPFVGITAASAKEVAKEIVYYTTVMGGNRPVLFGRFPALSAAAKSNLGAYIGLYSGGTIKLLDMVDVESRESVLHEDEMVYGDKSVDNSLNVQEGETRFSIRESNDDVAEGSIDDVKTQPLTFEEQITESLLNVSAENKENFALRASALRQLGQDLANVTKLMSKQREYDKSTVNQLVKLAKMYFKNAQLMGEVSTYAVGRVLAVINNVVGKKDIMANATKLMDILLESHSNSLEGILEKAEKVKAKKVNAAGVEVMGSLDVYAQETVDTYKAHKDWDVEELSNAVSSSLDDLGEAEEKMRAALKLKPTDDVAGVVEGYETQEDSADDAVKNYKTARAIYKGMLLAEEYRENVHQAKKTIDSLKKELIKARGTMSKAAMHEFVKSTNETIMETRIELIDALHNLIYKFTEDVQGGRARAKAFVQAQVDRAREIQHNANSDMEGISADVQGKKSTKWNNSLMRGVMSSTPTFQTMLKKFGEKAVDGKGYLYERFIPQATMASEKEFRGQLAARVLIDTKLKELYGKKADIAKFAKDLNRSGINLRYTENGVEKTFDLTKGQMLYIYMANKMSDGKMKLRKMGITEEMVANIQEELPDAMVKFADWVQDELLADLRERYNKVHERMFGAPMAAIENYFPLKIKKEARGEKGDVSQQDTDNKPSTMTGSIIKRTKNSTALDLSADALAVLLEHIDQMEHWAAYAEFNRDLNTLLNYRHFQNQVKNMSSVRYGSGDTLWKNFQKVAQIASGTYQSRPQNEWDRAVLNFSKGIATSKIAFRGYTALKQLLSAPAFWNEAGITELVHCYGNPMGSWNWALENLPGFKKRWEGQTAGNEKFLKSESDWELWHTKAVEKATEWGMKPNAFVDAVTVAVGARAVYETKLKQFKKAGYTVEKATQKALQAANEAYNESQQSSEGVYLSPIQADSTAASAAVTTFKNSNFGFTRKTLQAAANLKRKSQKDYKESSIEFMKKKLMRDGLSEEQAEKYAKKLYKKSLYKDVADLALFGFGLNLLWELGGAAIYLFLGDDDDEKEKMIVEAGWRTATGVLAGMPGGDLLADVLKASLTGEWDYVRLPMLVAAGDIESFIETMRYDKVKAANDFVNMLVAAGVHVNPQTLTDVLVALFDGDGWNAEEIGLFAMRFLNAPQSQLDKLEVDKAMENSARDLTEVMKRYVEYKHNKATPLTGWMYSDENEQKALERYAKRFDKLLDERFDDVIAGDAATFDTFYNNATPEKKEDLADKRKAFLNKGKEKEFVKLSLDDIVNNVTHGETRNEVYSEYSTAEDIDSEIIINQKRTELKPVYDALLELPYSEKAAYRKENEKDIILYKKLKKKYNEINKLKKEMKDYPEGDNLERMNKIRENMRTAMDLINNNEYE